MHNKTAKQQTCLRVRTWQVAKQALAPPLSFKYPSALPYKLRAHPPPSASSALPQATTHTVSHCVSYSAVCSAVARQQRRVSVGAEWRLAGHSGMLATPADAGQRPGVPRGLDREPGSRACTACSPSVPGSCRRTPRMLALPRGWVVREKAR